MSRLTWVVLVALSASGCERIIYGEDGSGDDGDRDQVVDIDFGPDAVAEYRLGNGRSLVPWSMLIEGTGRIVVTGSTEFDSTADTFVLALDSTGAPDESFGSGGYAETNTGGNEGGRYIGVTADGDYLLAASSNFDGGPKMGFIRFTNDGVVDSSFGPLGWQGSTNSMSNAGRFWVEGTGGTTLLGGLVENGDWDIGVMKLGSDEQLDTSFGVDGLFGQELDGEQQVENGIASADGGMLLGSFSGARASAHRVDVDGIVDLTFGDQGRASYLGTDTVGSSRVVDAGGGRFAIVGLIREAGESVVFAAYFLSDGTPDTLALVRVGALPSGLILNDAIIDDAGRVVVTGSDANDLFVLRLADGELDASFGADGWFVPDLRSLVSGSVTVTAGRRLALAPSGAVIAVGTADEALVFIDLSLAAPP